MSPAHRYSLLRAVLVLLRRVSRHYSINFENAVESSRKSLRHNRG